MAIVQDTPVLHAYGQTEFIDSMKAAYFAIPLATAFSMVSLPAGAETRLGLELVRIREGAVKPLPMVSDNQALSTQSPTGQANIGNLIAQSNPSGEGGPSGVRTISPSDESFSINFNCSLLEEQQPAPPVPAPAIPGLWMFLPLINEVRLVKVGLDDPTKDEVIKTFSSGEWQLSRNNTRITFDISDVEKVPGQVYRFDFYPAAPCERVDERRYRVPAAPVTQGGPGNWWIIPLVIGAGVGICALAGCFDGGGNGDTPNGGGGRPSR